jgi:hypothetical protein
LGHLNYCAKPGDNQENVGSFMGERQIVAIPHSHFCLSTVTERQESYSPPL